VAGEHLHCTQPHPPAPLTQAHLALPLFHSHTLIILIARSYFYANTHCFSFLHCCFSFHLRTQNSENIYQLHRFSFSITFTIYSIGVYTAPITSRCSSASLSLFYSDLHGCPMYAHIVSYRKHPNQSLIAIFF
jgi:hypothetical protein